MARWPGLPDAAQLLCVDVNQVAWLSVLVTLHRLGLLKVDKRAMPARVSTRLTAAFGSAKYSAMCACVIRFLRSSMMVNALDHSMTRRLN